MLFNLHLSSLLQSFKGREEGKTWGFHLRPCFIHLWPRFVILFPPTFNSPRYMNFFPQNNYFAPCLVC